MSNSMNELTVVSNAMDIIFIVE